MHGVDPCVTRSSKISLNELVAVVQRDETADNKERGVEPCGGCGAVHGDEEEGGEDDEEVEEGYNHL